MYLSAGKMEELDIFHGDTVILRGKKRKEVLYTHTRRQHPTHDPLLSTHHQRQQTPPPTTSHH